MDCIYIWTDAQGMFRSKVRRIQDTFIPNWNYDGSSTGQATTENSEVILKPVKVYGAYNTIYALCATYTPEGLPVQPNAWHTLKSYENIIRDSGLKLGFEQEFFIYRKTGNIPLDTYSLKVDQGPFYCSVGLPPNSNLLDRKLEELVSEIYNRANSMGVQCTGYNLEVAPSQAEIQVCGPAIDACHDLMFLRYLLWDSLGKYGCYPVFDPKPLGSHYNGSGLHTNISTHATMQEHTGYEEIKKILTKFEATHKEHLKVYGKGNEARLTGHHETSSMERFTWGVASRASSVRIPNETAKNGFGYFEDRRPAANADPYEVCLRIIKTISEP